MNITAKIWDTAKTGVTVHAFGQDGTALCRTSIKSYRPAASMRSVSTAGEWVRSIPALKMCQTCEAKFFARVEAAEPVSPTCVCPALEPPAKYGHHVVCPLRTAEKEEDAMGLDKRRTTGPLTSRQEDILRRLHTGEKQTEIALHLNTSVAYINQEVAVIVAKMEARTSNAAIARYGSYTTYLKAADLLLERGIVIKPIDPAEEHVNHVVEMLAETLRRRALRLLPS